MPLRQTETLELLHRKPALVHGPRFLGNLARVQLGGRRGQGFPSRPPLTRNPSTPRHSAQTQKTHTGARADAHSAHSAHAAVSYLCFPVAPRLWPCVLLGSALLTHLFPEQWTCCPATSITTRAQLHTNTSYFYPHYYQTFWGGGKKKNGNAHAVIATIGLKYLFAEALVYMRLRRLFMP